MSAAGGLGRPFVHDMLADVGLGAGTAYVIDERPPVSPQHAVRHLPDDDLRGMVCRIGAGEPAAFDELYDLTHLWVGDVAYRTLRVPEYTAEVVQDVFLQVWQQSATFDAGRGPVLGWLAMLAHRRAVDRVRQMQRARSRDQRHADLEVTTVADVAELGLARVEAARVRAALHLLTPQHREALVLTFLDGHTHVQAARLLAIPVGTLKTRVRTGLIRLRGHLEPADA